MSSNIDEMFKINQLEVKSTAEMDWFDFETRMRRIMQELLEPTIKRSLEDKEKSIGFMKNIESLKERIDDIDCVLQKSQTKTTIFENINDKMVKIVADTKVDQEAINDKIRCLKDEIDNLKFDLEKKNQNWNEQEIYNHSLRQEINQFQELLTDHKQQIVENIMLLEKENMKNKSEMRIQLTQLDDKISESNKKLEHQGNEIKRVDTILTITKEQTIKNADGIQNLLDNKCELEKYNIQVLKFEGYFKDIRIDIEDVNNNLKETDNYIDKHVPIKIQNQISNSLHSFLPTKERREYGTYEYKTYTMMNELVLNDEPINRMSYLEDLNIILNQFKREK